MTESLLVLALYGFLGALSGLLLYLAIYKRTQRYFSIYLLYVMSSIFASQVYLSTNRVFITETGSFSSSGTHIWLFFLLNFCVVAGIGLVGFLTRLARGPDPEESDWLSAPAIEEDLGLVVAGLVAFAQLANVLITSPNGFAGEQFSRPEFYQNSRLSFLGPLFGELSFFVPVVASYIFFTASRPDRRWISALVLVSYFIFLKGAGHVFHGFLLPITMIAGLFLTLRSQRRIRVRIPVRIIVLALPILIGFVVFKNFENRGISAHLGGPIEGIIYRIFVLQGSACAEMLALWGKHVGMNFSDLVDGRDFWIIATMPPTARNVFLATGVNLQGALPTSFLLFAKVEGAMFLSFVYGALFGFANLMILAALRRGAVMALFPASYLWLWVLGAYSRAGLDELMTPKVAVMCGIYLILYNLRFGIRSEERETVSR